MCIFCGKDDCKNGDSKEDFFKNLKKALSEGGDASDRLGMMGAAIGKGGVDGFSLPEELEKKIFEALKASGRDMSDFVGKPIELDNLPIPEDLKEMFKKAAFLKKMLTDIEKEEEKGETSTESRRANYDKNLEAFELLFTSDEILKAIEEQVATRPVFEVGDIVTRNPENPGDYRFPLGNQPAKVVHVADSMKSRRGRWIPEDMVLACATPTVDNVNKIEIEDFVVDRQHFQHYDGEIYGGENE